MPKFSTKIKQISGNFKTVDGVDVDITQANLDSDLTTTTGVNLITNGDYSNGVTGWQVSNTNSANQSLSVNSNGQLKITTNLNTYGVAIQELPSGSIIEGKTYKFKFDLISALQTVDGDGNTVNISRPSAVRVSIIQSLSAGALSPANIINDDTTLTIGTNKIFYITIDSTVAGYANPKLAIGGRNDITELIIDNVSFEEYKHDEDVILISDNDETEADSSTTSKSKLFVLFNYIKNKLTNAGLTFPGFGTTAGTVLEGDTTIITQAQIDKLGHLTVTASTDLDTMKSDVSTNSSAISTNSSDISTNSSAISTNLSHINTVTTAITNNSNAIALNTAKTGITQQQADDITANNAKTGITSTQANQITTNTTNIGNKANSLNPVFRGTIATDEHTDIDSAITTNTTNISNKANTSVVNNALNNITLSSPTTTQIPLQATTISGTVGDVKTININAGENISFSNTTTGQFTIDAPSFGTSAGTMLAGNTQLVSSITAGNGISVNNNTGAVTITSTATATPGGDSGFIQFNNNGVFGATTLAFGAASGGEPASLSFGGTLKIHNIEAEADDRAIISTDNNETTISGRVNIQTREIKIQSTQQDAGTGRGDVVYYGSVADSGNLTAGKVYYYAPNGNWTLVNASAVGTSSGILGVALGASPTTNGLLVNGSVFLDHHAGTGDGQTLYLSTTNGQLTSTKPTGSNQVRIVGTVIKHHTNRCEVLFDPTNFDGQATNPTASFTDNKSLLLDGLSDYAWNTSLSGIDDWGKSKGTLSVWVNLNITDDNGKNLISFYDGDNTNFGNFLMISYFKVSSSRYALLVRQRRTESGTIYNFNTVAQQSSSFHGRPFQRTASSFNSIQENYNSIRTSDTWTHIVYTWDNTETYQYNNTTYYGNQHIYVNGELKGFGQSTVPSHNGIGTAVTTGSFPPDRSTSFTHLVVGSLNPLAHGLTNMKVNDLAIWDVDLNQNNVTAIYNSSTNNYANGSTTDLLTDSGNYNESGNLAGYWKFEDNLNDSKNSNHLTGVGTTFDTSTP